MENGPSQERFDRILDLQAALSAGMGLTSLPDERGQRFDNDLHDGTFGKSGLQEVAETLAQNLRRLHEQAMLPFAVFNYGRKYQEVFTRFCLQRGRDPLKSHGVSYSANEPRPSQEDFQFFCDAEEALRKWICGVTVHPTEIGGGDFFHVAGFAGIEWDNSQMKIEGFVGSVLIQAWTVFESLSEDLWEAGAQFPSHDVGRVIWKGIHCRQPPGSPRC